MRQALLAARDGREAGNTAPTVIICQTVKGKGVSFMEDKASWHGNAPSAEQADLAREELDAANKQLADAREKAGQAQTQLTEQSNNLNQLSTLLPKEELEARRLELAEAQKQLDYQLVNIQTGESELATKQKDLEKAKEDLKI